LIFDQSTYINLQLSLTSFQAPRFAITVTLIHTRHITSKITLVHYYNKYQGTRCLQTAADINVITSRGQLVYSVQQVVIILKN